jgi:chromosome segregation ATPase
MDTAEQLERAAGLDDVQRARFAEAIRGVIADELDLRLASLPPADTATGSAQAEFFKNRLAECESELRALRATAAQLVTDLAVTTQRAEIADRELSEQRQANEKLLEQVRVVQESADGNRRFALMAIDEVRGEVRHWKDRCADLELQRQRDFQQLDAMRRLVSEQNKARDKGLR